MQVRTVQGDTFDLLCWRHLGRTAGVTELALKLNPSLANIGPSLPGGLTVTLPDLAKSNATAQRDTTIKLWD